MNTRNQVSSTTQQTSQQPKSQSKLSQLALNKHPRMIGPYQVGEILGRGACGKVYKGLNFQTGQLVAIKQIALNHFKEEQKQSIQMEINLLKKLDHPNIVKYIDSIYTEHHLNIILEYVENGSLESLIKKFGKLPETLAAIYVQQVLHGLDYLHSQGVIHRDIKGGNILTTKDGIVKLADFGVATKLTDTEKSNSFAGTPYWMAPEVIEMNGQVTSACDIWSLGCTVIELLTSRPPYFDLNQFSAMTKIVKEAIPPLPEGISDELKDFMKRCFNKDPFSRIDAKSLQEHAWLKKYDKNIFQKYIQISSIQLPEVVTNTIKMHIEQTDKSSALQKSQQKRKSDQSERNQRKPHAGDEDEDGELGDFGEEINDMNDVPIEKPKCLSSISNNLADKQITSLRFKRVATTSNQEESESDMIIPSRKVSKLNTLQDEEIKSNEVEQQKSQQNDKQMYQQVQLRQASNTVSNSTSKSSMSISVTNNIKQDKSAGPESGDRRMLISLQTSPQNILQQQETKDVFSVQGNRKIYYLTKKLGQQQSQRQVVHSHATSAEEAQISSTTRQNRKVLVKQKTQQSSIEQQNYEIARQQQLIQQQQQISNVAFKSKSNDIQSNVSLSSNSQTPQYHHHHNTTTMNYKQGNQNPLNFQFQTADNYHQISPSNIPVQADQMYKNFQHQHNLTSMGSPQHYNTQEQFMMEQQVSPLSSETQKRRAIVDQRSNMHKQYSSDSNYNMQQQFKMMMRGNEGYQGEDMYDELNDNLGQITEHPNEQFQQMPQYHFGGSADFNMRNGIQQQQQQFYHSRISSSVSQLNAFQDQQQHHAQSSIEDHIKMTQLSEHKLGRAQLPPQQLYGGQNSQYHVQHKSVISNFQGFSGSPANYNHQQQFQPLHNPSALDNSFENYFENTSNNNFQTNNDGFSEPGGLNHMINMQDLINVRESYSKKMLEEQDQINERKMGFLMMMLGQNQIGITNNLDQLEAQLKRIQSKNGRNSSQQHQSLGSGRNNNSNNQKQFDMLLAQQIQDEVRQYSITIKQLTSQLDAGLNIQIEEEQERKMTTEENQDCEKILPDTPEAQLALNIRKLTQILKENGTDLFKDQIVKQIGYLTLLSLLDKCDDIAYPSLQLINQICENSSKHQEVLCLSGLIPFLIRFGTNGNPREIQVEVAYFIGQVYQCSREALQMFISNQGLQILIEFLNLSYEENKDLLLLAIDSFLVIYDEQTNLQIPHEEMSVILTRMGLLENLTSVLQKLVQNAENNTVINDQTAAEKYLEKAFDVLQQLASGTSEVKIRLCSENVIVNLLQIIQQQIDEPSYMTTTIVKRFIKILQIVLQEPLTHKEIEKNGAIRVIIDMLQFFLVDIEKIELVTLVIFNKYLQQLVYDTLKLLNTLCMLSPSRTEQAALSSLLAPIKDLIIYLLQTDQINRSKRSKLMRLILSIIQEFIKGSQVSRQLLNGFSIQHLLLSIIQIQQQPPNIGNSQLQQSSKDHTINASILNIFVLWLQTDSSQIESFLAKRQTLEVFFNIFLLSPRNKVFQYVFSSLNRIVKLSPLIAKTLAQNSHLIDKLSQQLLQLDQSVSLNDELVKQNESRGYHHSKNSSSARSFNNLIGNGLAQNQLKTIEEQPRTTVQTRNSLQAQIMKELMEIFQVMCLKPEIVQSGFVERHNLARVITKVAQTAEQHNLVILLEIAQNILQSQQQNSYLPNQEIQINRSQQVQRQQQMINSTRSKSPLQQ